MKLFLGRGAWWLPLFAVIGGCSIYDSSLLGTGSGGAGAGAGSGPGPGGTGGTGGIPTSSTGGGGTGGIATTSTGGGGATGGGGSGTGGTVACSAPGDCPGMDTTCKTRTCDAHVCGAHPTDKNIACTETANGVCDGDGKCVECNDGTQCAMSHICAANNTCAAASCSDGVQNGSETDSDCGGSCAKKCGFNEHCMQGSDCKGGTCTTQVCVATCSDGVQNGSETDGDCGGSCPKCADGKHCSGPGDCTSGSCAAGTCQFVLLISEIKTRGVAGGSDEFVELYNPTSSELVLDGGWSIEVRSSTSSSYTVKAFGSGVHIPSHHHYLLSGADYPGGATCGTCPGTPCGGVPCADFTALPGIKDAASVAILHSGAIVDAVCFSYNQTTHDAIVNGIGYVCEGNLASNLPHNDVSGAGSNVDVGLERKPGGGAGNATDSGDSAADFNVGATSNPQNLLSGPT